MCAIGVIFHIGMEIDITTCQRLTRKLELIFEGKCFYKGKILSQPIFIA